MTATASGGFRDRFDYRVDILARRNEVVARLGEQVLARTVAPLLVDEQDHGLVFYFPVADVDLTSLVPVDLETTCPYKGTASYWRASDGTEPIAWTYPAPHPEVARLADHVAFYQDRVSVEIGVARPAVVGYPA